MTDSYYTDVIGVEVLKDYELYLHFEDGQHGRVDISQIIPFQGIFAPLKNKDFFSTVHVNSDIGTICWENGADLSPVYLLQKVMATNNTSHH